METSKSNLRGPCGTGIEGLDEVLRGGFPRGRVYLVQGNPGVGKTTLALQFLLEGVRQGERGLYVTLSETKDELLGVGESHGWPLDKLSIFELSALEQQLAQSAQNTLFHPSEIELSKTTEILLEEIERVKPMRLALDSLSGLRLLSETPLRYRRQMLALKQFFGCRNCTVLLLDERVASPESSDLQVQSIAHGVVTLDKRDMDFGAERRRLKIDKMRGLKFRAGSHDYVLETGGIKVFTRLVANEHHKPFPEQGLSSNIPELDALLGGGLDRGTSTLVLGPAGTGKSTIAFQYVVAAARAGEKSLIFAFDETLKTLVRRTTTLGLPVQEHIDSGMIRLQQVDSAELTPGEMTHQIKIAVLKEGVRLIVFDSLNGYLQSMPDERFLELQLHELLTFLNQLGVVTIATLAQHGLVGAMQSPVDVTYLADTVVLLRFFEAFGAMKKAISVFKKRSGKHEETIREFKIEAPGVRVGRPLTDFQGVLTGVPKFLGQADTIMSEGDEREE